MRRSLLIVDDDPRVLSSLSAVLADPKTEIRTADSGEAALQSLAGDTQTVNAIKAEIGAVLQSLNLSVNG